jgi:hypothetical protein
MEAMGCSSGLTYLAHAAARSLRFITRYTESECSDMASRTGTREPLPATGVGVGEGVGVRMGMGADLVWV